MACLGHRPPTRQSSTWLFSASYRLHLPRGFSGAPDCGGLSFPAPVKRQTCPWPLGLTSAAHAAWTRDNFGRYGTSGFLIGPEIHCNTESGITRYQLCPSISIYHAK